MADFQVFKHALAEHFGRLSVHELFSVRVDRDEIWQTYLASFPPGSNPIHRVRAEYDCSCCRQFVRTIGNCVAIIDGEMVSIWDTEIADPAFQAVAKAMSSFIRACPIDAPFLHYAQTVGTDHSHELVIGAGGEVRRWDHFHVVLPKGSNVRASVVRSKDSIATALGEARTNFGVLLRALTELERFAVDAVLELIASNALYRGREHEAAVKQFSVLKDKFDLLTHVEDRHLFVWSALSSTAGSVARFKNTAIGTLVTELSQGMPLEEAVGRFEAMVAPTNYKRTTALVTPRMVEDAKAKVEALGLGPSLHRRYARIGDISINDIIFADRSVKPKMARDVFETIATKKPGVPKDMSSVQAVSIEDFVTSIVPTAEKIEIMLENRHTSNLVSMIAPEDKSAKSLFKWSNGFSWAYNGDVTDSIKERVKKAGGSVTGDLCCRLAWFNYDDLDFHMVEPDGYRIYFSNRSMLSPSGGRLDVDMNAGRPETREPVENIFYSNRTKMKEGIYKLYVHQFARRETTDIGFEVEIDCLGAVTRFAYDKSVQGYVQVAAIKFSYAGGFEIIESLPSSSVSKAVWGLPTQDFHPVSLLMRSPNHWDGEKGIGNKHYFFVINGCANPEAARGFFNEFLTPELEQHRKVFELVGAKMKAEPTPEQLSGLGFSDTIRTEFLVRITRGGSPRTLRVTI